MIQIKNVSFAYPESDGGALFDVTLNIPKGECVLLCGESGCGKTTLSRLVNGLIPHYYEGKMSGSVFVNGSNVSGAELYETARKVGSVFQNPRSQFFCVDTTSEIAFGCENMGYPVPEIEKRVQKAADELDVVKLLGRNIFELSGGEKQKVACASVSAMLPDVFVLDEPTSNLDMSAIDELRHTLLIWKAQGKTILIAEHRLSWLRGVCDRVVYMKKGRVELDVPASHFFGYTPSRIAAFGLRSLSVSKYEISAKPYYGKNSLELQDFEFSYDDKKALSIPSLSLPEGGIIAVVGHNGAGKSTFCRCLCGLERRFKGTANLDGTKYNSRQLLKKCYMVMQDVNHQLFCESVIDEVSLGADDATEDDVYSLLEQLGLESLKERHPMSLSGGQKQRVAIASAILAGKEILIFDEPTSGLDYIHMEQTAKLLSSLQGKKTILVITHDPELIVRCASHVLHLENGQVQEMYQLSAQNMDRFYSFFNQKTNNCLNGAEFGRIGAETRLA